MEKDLKQCQGDGKEKKFSVVNFNSDNSVEAIPSSFLSTDKTQVRYPKNPPAGFKTLLEDSEATPDSSWETWEVTVVATSSKALIINIYIYTLN